VWGVAGVVGAAMQVALLPVVDAAPRATGAVMFAVAGAYQFTPWKSRCLDACTSPFLWFLRHWRDGARGAWVMGARHGQSCVGCCWALMVVAMIATTSGLVGMVVATVVMILEKLPAVGARLRGPIGVALLAASVVVLIANPGRTSSDQPNHHHHTIGANPWMPGPSPEN
jgi:predicted metal-binding membrane protein